MAKRLHAPRPLVDRSTTAADPSDCVDAGREGRARKPTWLNPLDDSAHLAKGEGRGFESRLPLSSRIVQTTAHRWLSPRRDQLPWRRLLRLQAEPKVVAAILRLPLDRVIEDLVAP